MPTIDDAAGGREGLLRLASAWHARVLKDKDYFAWATTTTMAHYHRSADDVPSGVMIPRWSWDGLVTE